MSPRRLALVTAGAAALLVASGAATPAAAFHHVFLPAAICGQSDFAGGANPTAAAALVAAGHSLPLPPGQDVPSRTNCRASR